MIIEIALGILLGVAFILATIGILIGIYALIIWKNKKKSLDAEEVDIMEWFKGEKDD